MTCPLCNGTGFQGPVDKLLSDKEFRETLDLAQVRNELSDTSISLGILIIQYMDEFIKDNPECGVERCFCSYPGDGLSHP